MFEGIGVVVVVVVVRMVEVVVDVVVDVVVVDFRVVVVGNGIGQVRCPRASQLQFVAQFGEFAIFYKQILLKKKSKIKLRAHTMQFPLLLSTNDTIRT